MNKTININLGGLFFHIDEDAYHKLNRYLEAIKRSLSDDPQGRDEIIADIEARVSELLSEKIVDARQVVNAQDIEDLIDGNICRCTGYRPILDAFKSFADDKDNGLQVKLNGMSEAAQKMCPITQQKCVGRNLCGQKDMNRQGSVKEKASIFGKQKTDPISAQTTSEGNWLFPKTLDVCLLCVVPGHTRSNSMVQ